MRPEDIDKLFKERLGNSSPTPPLDLWSRLQDRMEAELPQTAPLQPKEEKHSFMWVYSSVAASISMVLAVGVVFFNIRTGTPEISQSIEEKGRVEIQETPVYSAPVPESIAQAEVATETNNEEKNLTPQATDANHAASNMAEEDVKKEAIAVATPKAVQQKKVKTSTKRQPQATAQQAIAINSQTERAPEVEETVTTPAVKPVMSNALASAKADANMNAAPVEIIITRAGTSPTPAAMAEADEAQGGLDKKAKLAKNIFKQVRNLASGEEVELSELGINADKVALNTQIGKQKFSKVINL
ncbi:hypothetical protein ACFS7Z_01565 [Pontibacter toksunensis]|uniref:Uncharacterized protein n=1 Tax=Pontibacter toksunensis TaxID=1332631 RepID=A0ABW6BQI5_9BACT